MGFIKPIGRGEEDTMRRWNHHLPLLLEVEPIKGLYKPDEASLPKPKVFYNKGYRNLAYYLNTYITNSSQTLIDTGGASKNFEPDRGSALYTGTITATFYNHPLKYLYFLNFGSSTNPHDVTRYELYSRHFTKGAGGLGWLVEESNQTRIRSWHRYAFPAPSKSVGEVGLYIYGYVNPGTTDYFSSFLLARAILDPPVEREYNTIYEEGWEIIFPANYTRWFLRALMYHSRGVDAGLGDLIKAIDGNDYVVRQDNPFAGGTDIMIGRSNASPTPTDYHLADPIGSLSSQSQAVEIDTTLQECRIVRTGTYTPSVNETLGEVGLYCNVTDATGTSRKILIARGIWSPTVTLEANVTYTIGIVLKMG
jgi:hypothetical protein